MYVCIRAEWKQPVYPLSSHVTATTACLLAAGSGHGACWGEVGRCGWTLLLHPCSASQCWQLTPLCRSCAPPGSEVPGFGICRPAEAPHEETPVLHCSSAGAVSSCASLEDDDRNISRSLVSLCAWCVTQPMCCAKTRPALRCRASRMNCAVPGGTGPSAPLVQSHVADPAWGTSRCLTLLRCMLRGGACTVGGRSLGTKLSQYRLAFGPDRQRGERTNNATLLFAPFPGGRSTAAAAGSERVWLASLP